MESSEGAPKGKLYQEIRDKVIDSVVKAVVWAIAAVVLWALYTSYSLDSKVDRRHSELRGEMIDGLNDSVQRDADLQRQINEIKTAHPTPPPVPSLPGNPVPHINEPQSPDQHPLDYLEQHTKRYFQPK